MFVILTLAQDQGRWKIREIDVRAPHDRIDAEERLQ